MSAPTRPAESVRASASRTTWQATSARVAPRARRQANSSLRSATIARIRYMTETPPSTSVSDEPTTMSVMRIRET